VLPACPPVLPRCTIASGWHPPLHYLPQLCQGRAKLALHLLLVLCWFSVHTGHHTLQPGVLLSSVAAQACLDSLSCCRTGLLLDSTVAGLCMVPTGLACAGPPSKGAVMQQQVTHNHWLCPAYHCKLFLVCPGGYRLAAPAVVTA
jgi:hypothetical protein